MAEVRDTWSKFDIVAKIATTILVFVLGAMFTGHQRQQEASEKTAERIAQYAKLLYSDKVEERKYALDMLERERKKHPEEVGDLFPSQALQGLFAVASDENPQVAQQAQKLIKDYAQSGDATLEETVTTTMNQSIANATWAAVIGGDDTPTAAKDRVQKALNLHYSDAVIYRKRNSYRTVIRFPTKAEADSNLPAIRTKFEDAYVVNLSRWCSSPEDKNGSWSVTTKTE